MTMKERVNAEGLWSAKHCVDQSLDLSERPLQPERVGLGFRQYRLGLVRFQWLHSAGTLVVDTV